MPSPSLPSESMPATTGCGRRTPRSISSGGPAVSAPASPAPQLGQEAPAPAAEGRQARCVALCAADPQETVLQPAALQVGLNLATRKWAGWGRPVPRSRGTPGRAARFDARKQKTAACLDCTIAVPRLRSAGPWMRATRSAATPLGSGLICASGEALDPIWGRSASRLTTRFDVAGNLSPSYLR